VTLHGHSGLARICFLRKKSEIYKARKRLRVTILVVSSLAEPLSLAGGIEQSRMSVARRS